MRSLVATKSGNDSLLRRTLGRAERRRVNPTASTLPNETEGNELLERARNVTLYSECDARLSRQADRQALRGIQHDRQLDPTRQSDDRCWLPANVGEDTRFLLLTGCLPPKM